ncbi:NUDIX hydrolase [Ketogulonicigenium vulgare]|uniref:Hydrolase, NUDIX family protein n=1 Tax=Ketogulonicigenium vulgare (strain WSH-001) TaxID=759362 RepID=F9Y812_KETVW|nr:NUDIX hydrolase [Ketogulonicigenium vulgare]ADO42952.1 hydrolase, NUDIX family protein [Ketogulonicigenium vulgare Y25]AEM41138.1 Hydrolase, NUDIX family protein [Ketogulonicigenium vulgare WSH-001]ALJ82341.1 NUDIX hydrolase [Ketogulonicigenium vulgare]ANW34015.1 NUDIX hydrolase [Ketogulonicigenium vulgare]AOZ54860.1 hydrolase, NUDIX family protein [Ketogulonicigenium vulgare]
MFKMIWSEFIAPMLRRPARYQVAALCWRKAGDGFEVLLVTSLTSHRWIVPKGWPKNGRDSAAVALEEAWEEAGIAPTATPAKRIGQYHYIKRMRGNVPVRTEVDVFAIEVRTLLDQYPEVGRRERRWVAPAVAAQMVDEPELKALLRASPSLVGLG